MALKFYYDEKDDIFTIYDSETPPTETIEFSDFMNIDVNKNSGIVGFEIFDASKFFSILNELVNKPFLENIEKVSVSYKNYRNNWIISVTFYYKGQEVKVQMPPLKKSDYKSPFIASS